MGDLTTERRTLLIAVEINTIKHQTGIILLNSAMEIGRRLKEAKDMINYGEWGRWLEEEVNYSQKTAENLMRIFDVYGSQLTASAGAASLDAASSNTAASAQVPVLPNLNYTQALILLGVPAEERAQFIAELDVESMSTRELRKAVQERSQAVVERDLAWQEKAELQKTLEDAGSKITRLTQERDVLKTKAEQLSKSRGEAAEKAERLSLELKSQQQNTSAKAIARMSNNLNAAYHKAKANRIAFLLESMERTYKDLQNELKGFRENEPETYEVYSSKIVDFLTKGLKEKR